MADDRARLSAMIDALAGATQDPREELSSMIDRLVAAGTYGGSAADPVETARGQRAPSAMTNRLGDVGPRIAPIGEPDPQRGSIFDLAGQPLPLGRQDPGPEAYAGAVRSAAEAEAGRIQARGLQRSDRLGTLLSEQFPDWTAEGLAKSIPDEAARLYIEANPGVSMKQAKFAIADMRLNPTGALREPTSGADRGPAGELYEGVQQGLFRAPSAAIGQAIGLGAEALGAPGAAAAFRGAAGELPELTPEGVAGMVGEAAGSVAPSLAGLAGLRGPILAYYAVQGFGGGVEDYRATLEARGEDPTLIGQLATGVGYGAAELVAEKIGLDKIGRITSKTAGEIGDALLRRDLDKAVAKFVGAAGQSAAIEGGEEALTQLAQNTMAQLFDPDRPIGEGVGEAAVQGALGGALLGGAMQGGRVISERGQRAAIEEALSQADDVVRGQGVTGEEAIAGPESGRAVITEEPQEVTPEADPAEPDSGAPVRTYSPAAIEKRLAGRAEEIGAVGTTDAEIEENAGLYGVDFTTAFPGELPAELIAATEGRPELRRALQANRGSGALGEDSLAQLGTERYVQLLEEQAAPRRAAARRAAQSLAKSPNPQDRFDAFLYAYQSAATSFEKIGFSDLQPGDTLNVRGEPFVAATAPDGGLVLVGDVGEFELGPGAVGVVPADTGSLATGNDPVTLAQAIDERTQRRVELTPVDAVRGAVQADAPVYSVSDATQSAASSGPIPDDRGLQRINPTRSGAANKGVAGPHPDVRAVPLPELVEIAEKLLGRRPSIRRLRKALGQFSETAAGTQITIDPDVASDPQLLAQVLAHEIGHLIDYLPDSTLKRGNLVGRLHSLRRHLGQTYGDGKIKDKEIREELKALSAWWRPWNREAAKEAERRYRDSAVELYADAISVLLTAPDQLQHQAPRFYATFSATLDAKPEVKGALLSIQDILHGKTEDLIERRRARRAEAFMKGEDIIVANHRANRASMDSVMENIAQAYADRAAPLTRRMDKLEKQGVRVNDDLNMRYVHEELSFPDSGMRRLLERVEDTVVAPLRETGLPRSTFSEYLFLRRLTVGDRAETANPGGETQETAAASLKQLLDGLEPSQRAALARAGKALAELNQETLDIMQDAGLLTPAAYEKFSGSSDTYARFQVLKYIESDTVPAAIKSMQGTFSDVGDTFLWTVRQMMSLRRHAETNKAKRQTVRFLREHFPEETRSSEKRGTLRPGVSVLTYMDEGQVVHDEVPSNVVDVFDDWRRADAFVKFIGTNFYRTFHKLWVTWNPEFASKNLFRDMHRFARNTPELRGLGIVDTLRAYIKALPAAKRRAFQQHDKTVAAMEDARALDVPFAQFKFDETEADAYSRLQKQAGNLDPEKGREETEGLLAGVRQFVGYLNLVGHMERLNVLVETLPKVAAWNVLEKQGVGVRERAYRVRNQVGTPNYRKRGINTTYLNTLAPYSNVMIQGLSADVRVAKENKAAWLTRWTILQGIPKTVMFMGKAGLLGGVLKSVYDAIPAYELLNYLVIPIGWEDDEDDPSKLRVQYVRIPHDETSRMISMGLWHALNDAYEKDPVGLTEDLMSMAPAVLPGASPMVDLGLKWTQTLSGVNPYDSFRRRNIVDRTAWDAGRMFRYEAMLKYSVDQLGILGSFAEGWTEPPSQQDDNAVADFAMKLSGLRGILKESVATISDEDRRLLQDHVQEQARTLQSLGESSKRLRGEYASMQRQLSSGAWRAWSDRRWDRHTLLSDYKTLEKDALEIIRLGEDAGFSDQAERARRTVQAIAEGIERGEVTTVPPHTEIEVLADILREIDGLRPENVELEAQRELRRR